MFNVALANADIFKQLNVQLYLKTQHKQVFLKPWGTQTVVPLWAEIRPSRQGPFHLQVCVPMKLDVKNAHLKTPYVVKV